MTEEPFDFHKVIPAKFYHRCLFTLTGLDTAEGNERVLKTCDNPLCKEHPIRMTISMQDIPWKFFRWNGVCDKCGRQYYVEIQEGEASTMARMDIIMGAIRQMREWNPEMESMVQRVIRGMVLYGCDLEFARFMLETLVRNPTVLVLMDEVLAGIERESAEEAAAEAALEADMLERSDRYQADDPW